VSRNKPCSLTCTALGFLSAAAGGAFAVYVFVARSAGDEMDLSTVLDAGVIVTVLLATTVVVRVSASLVGPLREELAASRWEIRRLSRELRQLRAAQPTAKAIAGYAIAALVSDDDEANEAGKVRSIRG
jgi:hypothetical protein